MRQWGGPRGRTGACSVDPRGGEGTGEVGRTEGEDGAVAGEGEARVGDDAHAEADGVEHRRRVPAAAHVAADVELEGVLEDGEDVAAADGNTGAGEAFVAALVAALLVCTCVVSAVAGHGSRVSVGRSSRSSYRFS